MPTVPADARVEAWLADQPRDLRPVALAARDLLDEGLPGATHAIKWGWPTWVGRSNIASLLTLDGRVGVQFHRGALLADPAGALRGSGKQVRYLVLEHARDARVPAVRALVRAAWRLDQAGAS